MQGLRPPEISMRLTWNRGTMERKAYLQELFKGSHCAGTAENLRRFRLSGILILAILERVPP